MDGGHRLSGPDRRPEPDQCRPPFLKDRCLRPGQGGYFRSRLEFASRRRMIRPVVAVALAFLAFLSVSPAAAASPELPRVRLETSHGAIDSALDTKRAPCDAGQSPAPVAGTKLEGHTIQRTGANTAGPHLPPATGKAHS